MKKNLKILILEDNPSDIEFIKRALKAGEADLEIQTVETRDAFEKALDCYQPDVVLSDHNLPDFNSSEAFKIYEAYKQDAKDPKAFILITGSMSEEFAVKKIQEGVDDYILKDRMQRLLPAIDQALRKNSSVIKENKASFEQARLLNYIRLLLQSTHDGIYGVDADGKCTFINEAALNMLGYHRDQCIGKNMHRLIHNKKIDQRHYPEKECPVYKSFANHESCRIDDEVFWKSDGNYFHVEYHCSPIIEEGVTKGAVVMFIDISERVIQQKKKELIYSINKIFDEEEELSKCLDYLIKEICIYEGKFAGEIWITDVNEAELRLVSNFSQVGLINSAVNRFSFKAGEGFVGKVLRSKSPIYSDDVQKDKLYVRKDYATDNNLHGCLATPILFKEKPIAVIILYNNFAGNYKPLKFILQDELLIQIGQSIFRKRTENELSTIFNYSPDLICIIGDDMYFKKTNPAFTAVLNYPIEKLHSHPITDFLHSDDIAVALEELKKLQGEESSTHCQLRFLARDGSVRWLAWTFSLLNTDGMIMGIAKDVTLKLELEDKLHTEKIRQQIEITDAVMTAQESERQKIGGELHDNICQLLALSNMFIGLAEKENKVSSKNLEEAKKLVNAAINDIRNLSHELIPVMFNTQSLISSIKELAGNITFTTDLDINLSFEGLDDGVLSEDLKLGLYRIIQEQFNNIIKHADANKVDIILNIEKTKLTLKISDDGCGFDPSLMSTGIGLLNMETRVSVFKGRYSPLVT
jgi:PAS domain S-box-containing protein